MSKTNVLVTMKEVYPSMSDQQKKAAAYILTNYKQVAFLTSTKLASKAGVSPATINRLATTIGMDGYAAFQAALKSMVLNELTAIDRLQDEQAIQSTLKMVFENEAKALNQTLQQIAESDYQKVVSILVKARKLGVVGYQASDPLAQYTSYNFSKIRGEVERLDLSDINGFNRIGNFDKMDAAIVFGLPRYPLKTVQILEELAKRSVSIVLITNSEISPLCKKATVNLIIPVRYYQFTDGLSPVISLINALTIDVAQVDEVHSKSQLNIFESMASYFFCQI